MKILIKLFLLIFAALICGCKSDEIVNNNPPSTGSYEWTSTPVTYGFAYDVQVINRNSYFITTTSGLYKVTNNIPALFTVNNTVFKARAGYVYDDTYIVYKGNKVLDNSAQFMIYDNGTYTIYDEPQSDSASISKPFFESRRKFYYYLNDSLKYYKFDNGTFTSFSFPGSYAKDFGKANGNIYLFVRNPTFTRSIYRVTDSGPIFVREESESNPVHIINNDILSISNYPSSVDVQYFTEAGWTSLFTLPDPYHNYPSVIKGENKNGFEMVREDSASKFGAARWNGTSYMRQTNVPPEVNFNDGFFFISSGFRDNTFYLLVQSAKGSSKIIKGTYIE